MEYFRKYTHRRNDATHAIRKAKKTYEYRLARECKDNNKAVW